MHELAVRRADYEQIDQQLVAALALWREGELRYNGAVAFDELPPTPDLDPSPEFIAVVTDECQRLDELTSALRDTLAELEARLTAVEAHIKTATARRNELAHLIGKDVPEPTSEVKTARRRRVPAEDGRLRGAAIREAAVRAMLAQGDPERPRHYREWLALIDAAGQQIDGQDAAATLLTQLSRCPLIARADEPGTYRLDRGALRRLEDQRAALRAEADAKVVSTNDSDYDVIDLAQALAALESRVKRIDREIDEATKLVEELDARWFFTDDAPPKRAHASAAVAA